MDEIEMSVAKIMRVIRHVRNASIDNEITQNGEKKIEQCFWTVRVLEITSSLTALFRQHFTQKRLPAAEALSKSEI